MHVRNAAALEPIPFPSHQGPPNYQAQLPHRAFVAVDPIARSTYCTRNCADQQDRSLCFLYDELSGLSVLDTSSI